MSSKDKTLISDLMGSFVSEVPAKPFVSFCVFCNKGVIKEEMIYQKGYVFHKDCFNNHGSKYPQVNQESISQNSNDKVQLVQLRNLKIRMGGDSNSTSRPKSKKKSKRKTKKRTTKRKRTSTKRKKTKKKISRKKPPKSKRTTKRRTSPKRKKATRKTKRRASRKTKKKTRRRR